MNDLDAREGTSTVLVAGASGRLGREVVRCLQERGVRVRALARRPERLHALGLRPDEVVAADLLRAPDPAAICRGADGVISCVGASLDLRNVRDRAPFSAVDYEANRNLLSGAQAAGVGRFVYVSSFATPELSQTAYVQAHERFADLLRRSGTSHAVVRPTGLFYSFLEMLEMARSGRGLVIGPGEARTNPIHERDVAEICVGALEGEDGVVEAGGPTVYSRRAIIETAFEVAGRDPRVRSAPAGLFRAVATLLKPFQPRLAEFLRFAVVASTTDAVAPARGRRELRRYFEAAAGRRIPDDAGSPAA